MCQLKEFRLFVAAYEEGSFSGAARRENATQPGVSQHIQKLEGLLKVKLFHRTAKAIVATQAGEAYYLHCLELLRIHESASRNMQRFRGLGQDEITLGVTPWMAKNVLTPALLSFMELHTDVAVRVVETNSPGVRNGVRRGEFTLGLVLGDDEGPAVRPVVDTPTVLAWSSRRGNRFENLQGPLKLVLPGRETRWRACIDDYLTRQNMRVARSMDLSSTPSMIQLISTSDWVAILPAFVVAVDHDCEKLASMPLPDGPHFSVIFLHPDRPLSEAAIAFEQMLSDEIVRLQNDKVRLFQAGLGPFSAPLPHREPRLHLKSDSLPDRRDTMRIAER